MSDQQEKIVTLDSIKPNIYTKAVLKGEAGMGLYGLAEEGDILVNITMPSAGPFSIKNLNRAFGPDFVDELILPFKKTLLDEYIQTMQGKGVMAGYKQDTFLFKQPIELDLQETQTRLKTHIRDLAQQRLQAPEDDEARRLLQKMQEEEFELTFGKAIVGKIEGDDLSGVRLAYAEASFWARASKLGIPEILEDGVTFFDAFEIVIEEIKRIRQELMAQTVVIDNKNVKIFENEDSNISPAILRKMRKNQPPFDNQLSEDGTVKTIRQYKALLNAYDYTLFQTAEEVAGKAILPDNKTLAQKAHEITTAEYKFRNGDNAADHILKQFVNVDQRDARFSSPEIFEKETLKKPNCTYIGLDAIDLGLDVLREYETKLLKIEGAEAFRGFVLSVGDSTTAKMREIRNTVSELFDAFFPESDASFLVGGDEFTISFTSPEDQSRLALCLKNISSRARARVSVVKTARVSNNTSMDIKAGHAKCMSKLHEGENWAKEIEEFIRTNGFRSDLQIINELGKGYFLAQDGNSWKLVYDDTQTDVREVIATLQEAAK